ncbi:lipoprotein signal peptidase [Winogradskyella immobilis]|uniref:Lipoprotein signal peptidase n=1 Tax=Winogradskyella immobilis TaxID=2816852 RepID=A0ABS8EQ57_9FLAO|nr:lipoprotein signal peptidase [Winogradskyella immobilis]MCC1485308.1 lipoprotein signal peptidase [Winogradskyella immobilis]MCG0017400.1 lipoprotein signal peptidase [Winogradskyella immobilis]
MSLKKAIFIIICVLLIDQISKIYIKTHFELDETVPVFSWFKIVFVENEGMAWGTKLSDVFSFISDKSAKLILTLFRIVAVTAIGFWLVDVIKKEKTKLLIFAIALIFSGALGNIIDSVFYGVLFNDSVMEVATFLPEDGGYANVFHGNVVDMLHFPLWSGVLPEWIPFLGGKYISFFDPVFNVADMAISTGIGILIVFNKRAFKDTIKTDTIFQESHNNPV